MKNEERQNWSIEDPVQFCNILDGLNVFRMPNESDWRNDETIRAAIDQKVRKFKPTATDGAIEIAAIKLHMMHFGNPWNNTLNIGNKFSRSQKEGYLLYARERIETLARKADLYFQMN